MFRQRDRVRPPASREAPITSQSNNSDRAAQIARSRQLACQMAQAAEDYRGKDTIVLDMTPVTPIVDFMVITTGTSRRQMIALSDEAQRLMKSADDTGRQGVEGYGENVWVLQDFGDIILHVFSAEARALYDLEHLWADAPRVDWRSELADTRQVQA